MQVLNRDVEAIYEAVGKGKILAVPLAGFGSGARLFDDPRFHHDLNPIPVSDEAAAAAVIRGHLSRLTEQRDNGRLGWRELMLPGNSYELYAAIQ